MGVRCDSGKRFYETYGKALSALIELEKRQSRSVPGSCYRCSDCDGWHISSRKFTVDKKRGRGKRRRGVLDSVG